MGGIGRVIRRRCGGCFCQGFIKARGGREGEGEEFGRGKSEIKEVKGKREQGKTRDTREKRIKCAR